MTRLYSRWEKNWVSLDKIDEYVGKMKGKLSQNVATSGAQIYEAGDSTTVGAERPALPAGTYALRRRHDAVAGHLRQQPGGNDAQSGR